MALAVNGELNARFVEIICSEDKMVEFVTRSGKDHTKAHGDVERCV
jgi:hypothetical protein